MSKHLSDDPHFTNYQSEKPPVYKPKDLIILGLINIGLPLLGSVLLLLESTLLSVLGAVVLSLYLFFLTSHTYDYFVAFQNYKNNSKALAINYFNYQKFQEKHLPFGIQTSHIKWALALLFSFFGHFIFTLLVLTLILCEHLLNIKYCKAVKTLQQNIKL